MTTDYRLRQQNRAIFTPAVQSGYNTLASREPGLVRGGNLPTSLPEPRHLDYLDAASPLFHTDRALLSIGQWPYGSVPTSGMCRKRPGVTLLGDSMGYQLIEQPALWRGDETRAWVLGQLELNFDEAITLDNPTRAIQNGNPLFNTFDKCLDATYESLEFFRRKRTPGRVRYLSSLQGTTRSEGRRWYDRVKQIPFEGWALGGDLKLDWGYIIDLIVQMKEDGLIGRKRNRLHVLGTGTLASTRRRSLRACSKSCFSFFGGQRGSTELVLVVPSSC
jgi:hypothetical protein